MRTSLVALLAVAASVAVASPASAKDLSGRFGLGYTTTLPGTGALGPSSLNALSGRFWVNKQIGLEANLGYTSFSPKGGSNESGLGIGVGGMFAFVDETNMHVYGDVGLSFGQAAVVSTGPTGGVNEESAFGITAGLGSEFFFADLPNLGFTTGVGLSYSSVSNFGSTVSLGGADYATLGIRYYFGGAGANTPK